MNISQTGENCREGVITSGYAVLLYICSMIRSRFAPTPSGYLHAGNAASFVLTWLLTRIQKGTILLRIDDLDQARMREPFVEDIFRTLDWLELDYDSGPTGPEDFHANWSQLLRLQQYEEVLGQLSGTQNLIFACECSRSQLTEGVYPGTCLSKNIPLNTEGVAWRIKTNARVDFNDLMAGKQVFNLESDLGTVVIRSRNSTPAYRIASLSDDLYFGINFIVRGQDLLPTTASQLYLGSLLKTQAFSNSKFLHHPLVKDPRTGKLSKSAGAGSLKTLRESGAGPEFIYAIVAGWLGMETVPHNSSLDSLDALVRTRYGW
jgi:glutamyl/glutaminyl-tRNA synthetase